MELQVKTVLSEPVSRKATNSQHPTYKAETNARIKPLVNSLKVAWRKKAVLQKGIVNYAIHD